MNSLHRLYDTRMFLPAWWVESYDNALKADLEQNTTLDQATMLPLADAGEVYVQSFLLAEIQRKILGGAFNQAISLDLASIEKQIYRKSFRTKFVVPKVLYSAGAMKLLDRRGDKFQCISLFQDTSFQKKEIDRLDSWHVELTPDWQYWDAFFGYVFGYEELLRLYNSRPSLAPVLGKLGPLCLWRSIWLDLQGVEQGLFLRMEKSVQWHEQCVHWQGIFAAGLEDIFRSFSFANQKMFNNHLSKQLHVLERLSQKLVDHGYLTQQIPSEYLVLAPEQAAAQFAWKVSNTRFLADDYVFLQRYLCRYYMTHRLKLQLTGLGSFLGADSVGGLTFTQVIEKLQPIIREEHAADQCLIIDGNTIVPLVLLFAEWLLRCQPGAKWPLPEDIKAIDGVREVLACSKNLTEIKVHFLSFVYKMSANPGVVSLLETQPLATLVSQVSLSMLRKPESAKASAQAKTATVTPKEVSAPAPSAPTAVAVGSGDSLSIDKLSQQLLQTKTIVLGELDRMKDKDRASYLKLTNAYIESLDSHSQKLILDIKQKMQPKIFDHHIKQRLLQFMVDHPGKWQNPSAGVVH